MKSNNGNSAYLKSIATLMSGSIIAQLFTMLCSPILTRLCSPEVMGVYSLVTGAVTMFGMVMSLRYELCIVSEPDESQVYPLIKASFLICLILSLFITFGYLIYFRTINTNENYVILALITGLLVLLMGIINIVTAYNNRQKEYKLITNTYVIRVLSQNICNLIAAFLGFGAIGLSFSQFVGYLAGIYGQAKSLLVHKTELKKVSYKSMCQVAKANRKQALISSPATLANGLSYSLINYFIEALFSTAVVGYYSISYRILGLPITLISGNVSKVFLEKASKEYQSKGNFKETYKYTVVILILLGLPIGIGIMFLAPWACEILFGNGWGIAGVYIRILTPMFILRFIAGGINCSAIIANKQQYDFIIQFMLSCSTVIVFIFSRILHLTVEEFLLFLNILFCLIYIVYIILFWKCAQGRNNKVHENN